MPPTGTLCLVQESPTVLVPVSQQTGNPQATGQRGGNESGVDRPCLAWVSTGHRTGPRPRRNKQNPGVDCDRVGVSLEREVLANDPIFEQTAILGDWPPLQGLWIFHEATAWASHTLGPPAAWVDKAPFTGSGGSVY